MVAKLVCIWSPGRPIRWEDNIKMDLKITCEDGRWMKLVRDHVGWGISSFEPSSIPESLKNCTVV